MLATVFLAIIFMMINTVVCTALLYKSNGIRYVLLILISSFICVTLLVGVLVLLAPLIFPAA
jgi:hypothetical protein